MLTYIHIPFCHEICPYCSFYKHKPGSSSLSQFVQAILKETEWQLSHLDHPKIRTLYLGGGTPSLLSARDLTSLFTGLQRLIDFSQLDEVSLEANPKTFNAKKAQLFRKLGISRVSLGVQSFLPHILKTLGRDHSPNEAEAAYLDLKNAGIPQVNIDLMFSIPGQSLHDWQLTLDKALSLQPDHISAYNLTYEEDTPFLEALSSGKLDECEDRNADHFKLADTLLTNNGFEHYETSNYAQPGMRSQHNSAYWSGEDYLGIGPSAVSTIGSTRSTNIPDTAAYIQQVNSLGHALKEKEILNQEALRLERIALLMRTSNGAPLHLFQDRERHQANLLIEENLLQQKDDHFVAIGRGRLLVDELVTYLI